MERANWQTTFTKKMWKIIIISHLETILDESRKMISGNRAMKKKKMTSLRHKDKPARINLIPIQIPFHWQIAQTLTKMESAKRLNPLEKMEKRRPFAAKSSSKSLKPSFFNLQRTTITKRNTKKRYFLTKTRPQRTNKDLRAQEMCPFKIRTVIFLWMEDHEGWVKIDHPPFWTNFRFCSNRVSMNQNLLFLHICKQIPNNRQDSIPIQKLFQMGPKTQILQRCSNRITSFRRWSGVIWSSMTRKEISIFQTSPTDTTGIRSIT